VENELQARKAREVPYFPGGRERLAPYGYSSEKVNAAQYSEVSLPVLNPQGERITRIEKRNRGACDSRLSGKGSSRPGGGASFSNSGSIDRVSRNTLMRAGGGRPRSIEASLGIARKPQREKHQGRRASGTR